MIRNRTVLFLFACCCLAAIVATAQLGWRDRRQRAFEFDRGNVPLWEVHPEFPRDGFTFARIRYTSSSTERSSRAWWTDYPDADLNMSWRLHQLTSMSVHPDGKVIELTDPELCNYPFVFMSGVPAIAMSDEEVGALRRYLLNGGFLMVDDFWGEANWEHFYREVIKRVFPDREPQELPLDHPIFHCIFDLKEKPQIPNVNHGIRSRETGITWEVPDGTEPHYRVVLDDRERIMMFIGHNTDLGDGWEEEGTDPYYFSEFSEKKAYPLGINIVFYIMTH